MSRAERIELVMRACDRARKTTRLELERGLSGLVFVCRIAPWIGVGLTAWQIAECFQGVEGERMTAFFRLLQNLAITLHPLELGVAIGIGALVAHRWLFAQCESLEQEMRSATLELANELSRLAQA